MFNNTLIEQFLALQGKSLELTGNLRAISMNTGGELMNIHLYVMQELGSMGQNYLAQLGAANDPAETSANFQAPDFGDMLEYWGGYQDKLRETIHSGSHEFMTEIESLSGHLRSDFENIVSGFTSIGPIAGTPFMAAIKTGLDLYMQSFDQLAASTKTAIGNIEKLSDVKV